MAEAIQSKEPAIARIRKRINRSRQDQMVSGLAAGISESVGLDPIYGRAAFIILTFAGGIGLVAYLFLWVLSTTPGHDAAPHEPATPMEITALLLMYLGALIALRTIGLWFGDNIVWPTALVVAGLAVIWDKVGSRQRLAQLGLAGNGDAARPTLLRVAIGAAIMISGLAAFFGSIDQFRELGTVVLGVAITGAGFMLIFGPWVWSLGRGLAAERSERIRSEEREEVATHLHDSVLQTLALIQRTEDPRRMVTLARAQERELRTWLYTGSATAPGTHLKAALEHAAGLIEASHDIPVEVVTVGDTPLDDALSGLVKAAAEAMTNAAVHSGAPLISVYTEVGPSSIEVFVSDQGKAFKVDDVPADRRGIRDSIKGRMRRLGGTAIVTSDPTDGTEVHLSLPREAS